MLSGGAFGYLADYLLWWLLFASLVVHTWCFFRFFPREQFAKAGLIVGNLLVFACMLGVVALAGETYFRFVAVETDAFGMSLPARRWFAIYTRLNSLGCRDHEWTPEPPDSGRSPVRRIAFVGDSFTYGWGIEREPDRFTERIQAMFDRVTPGTVEVLNVAKPGWDTGAELQPVKDMIDVYGVDEVVLCYVPNDIEKLLPRSPDFDPIRPPQPKWFNPTSSCLVDYLYYRVWAPRAQTVAKYHDWLAAGFTDPEIWRRHRQQLAEIIQACRQRNVEVRAVLLPFLRISGEQFRPRRIHGRLVEFFKSQGVEVVDLLPTIASYDPDDLVVNGHDAHPNALAHKLFADAIWRAFYGG